MSKILFVDDDEDQARLLAGAMQRRGFDAAGVTSAVDALQRVEREAIDVVVTDLQMTDMSGFELCPRLHDDHPDLLAIMITGHSSLDSAIAAMRAGAYDYICKPVNLDALSAALVRALGYLELRREVKRLRTVVHSGAFDGIAGESRAIQETLEMVRRVADGDATVLLRGESGTGKELVARALHQLSVRRGEPFVAVNCAAVPAALLESELFGHVRGAFTDARQSRQGMFSRAGKGTIFLDELGEMPLEMQAKLLRALQAHAIRPVGGDQEMPFEARVIAATNRDLEAEVAARRFREDLYYRVNVVGIALPPLRERAGDVLLLAQYFLARVSQRTGKQVTGLTPEAARLLLDYDWPGNVRELENCMERAVALCQLDQVTPDVLPDKLHTHQRTSVVFAPAAPDELITLEEMERRYVRQVLAAFGGNKAQAARVLGIDRRSLYRRLSAYASLDP